MNSNSNQNTMKTYVCRFVLGIFAALLVAIATSGCKHTAHGAGEDIEKVGEKIQDKTK